MPTGFETYTFCLMIVSRGAVYHTRKSAGEFKHFHRGCDCKVAPSCVGNIDKTKAFEFALGFAPSDALEVIRQLYGLIADNLPAYKAMGPAKRYEHLAGSFGFDARVARREVKNLLGHNIGGRGFSLLSPIG